MKKTLITKPSNALFIVAGLIVSSILPRQANGQLYWDYDFGTSTGTYANNAISTNFLPATRQGGGTAMVRIGGGGGSFTLTNSDVLGSGSALVGIASSNTSVNKFSIYDFSNPSATFSLSFDMRLSGGSSGQWLLFAGNGASFTNGNSFTGAETFSGVQLGFDADDSISVNTRTGSNWTTLNGTGIGKNTNYTISIFGNNSGSATQYISGSITNALASNTWDLWVGSTKVGSNLAKAQLGDGSVIDSFMFYGASSTGNAATIAVDNFTYANHLYIVPEPSTYALLILSGAGCLVAHEIRRRHRRLGSPAILGSDPIQRRGDGGG